MNPKLNMSQQCDLIAEKGTGILERHLKCHQQVKGSDTSALLSTGAGHTWSLGPVTYRLRSTRDMDRLDIVQ